jgi:hypothetical protein
MSFWEALFDNGEHTCFTTDPKGITVLPVSEGKLLGRNYFSINPLHATADLAPNQSWHDPLKPRRADANVIAYRNFLIEMDKIDVDSQIAHINAIKMPYTTAVFSGSKSIHFIISLEIPCEDAEKYRELAKRIQRAVGLSIVDKSTSNPSRLSRVPEAIRNNGQVQNLLACGARVPRLVLEAWLKIRLKKERKKKPSIQKTNGMLPISVHNFLKNGAQEGEWNTTLFGVCKDLAKMGLPRQAIIATIESADNEYFKGVLDSKDLSTLDSAIRSAQNST